MGYCSGCQRADLLVEDVEDPEVLDPDLAEFASA